MPEPERHDCPNCDHGAFVDTSATVTGGRRLGVAPVVADGEIIRLRNRITALEANGSELLARAERAEEERDAARLVSKGRTMEEYDRADELERLRARLTGVAIHANRLQTRIAPGTDAWTVLGELRDALHAPHSPADAPSPVSAATEAHGETEGAQRTSWLDQLANASRAAYLAKHPQDRKLSDADIPEAHGETTEAQEG